MSRSHRFVFVIVATVVIASCCSGDDKNRSSDPAAMTGDQRARARAVEMQDKTRDCEAGVDMGLQAPCRRACELGNSNSCFRLANYIEAAGGDGAARRALTLYLNACAGGSGGGCDGAARLNASGHGTAADPARADALYRKARIYHRVHCSQQYTPSCLGLAKLYHHGLGGPPDLSAAATYYKWACDQGDDDGCAGWKDIANR